MSDMLSEDPTVVAARELLGMNEAAEEEADDATDEEGDGEDDALTSLALPTFSVDEDEEDDEDVPDDDEDEEDEELDSLDPKVRARVLAAEKKAAHYEKLRVKEGRKAWQTEALKVAPLSEPFLEAIEATSRTAYLKEAKRIHAAYVPFVQSKILAPYDAAIETVKTEARAEARKAAEVAWGRPPGSNSAPVDATDLQDKIKTARQKKDFVAEIKAMMGGS